MEHTHLSGDVLISDLPINTAPDCVFALILNEANEALILEADKPDGHGVYWQMIGADLAAGEEPFTAVQQKLLAVTGYQTAQWSYLGSHTSDGIQQIGASHFFCAQKAHPVAEVPASQLTAFKIKWVSMAELRCALLDGRITLINHALAVSLALLTILK